jgi:hypothetical protein
MEPGAPMIDVLRRRKNLGIEVDTQMGESLTKI